MIAARRIDLTSSEMVAALAACGIAAAEARRRRRRRRLERALHELRRPLQALLLCPGPSTQRLTAVDLALAALRDLEVVLGDGRGALPGARLALVSGWPRLLGDAADRWRQAAALRGGRIAVRSRLDGTGPPPREAAIMLSQALDNLILNALTHGGASVTLTAQPVGGTAGERSTGIELIVADRGRPLPQARSRRHGHGLGVVSEIAERLHGDFEFEPTANGSHATIRLPGRWERP